MPEIPEKDEVFFIHEPPVLEQDRRGIAIDGRRLRREKSAPRPRYLIPAESDDNFCQSRVVLGKTDLLALL